MNKLQEKNLNNAIWAAIEIGKFEARLFRAKTRDEVDECEFELRASHKALNRHLSVLGSKELSRFVINEINTFLNFTKKNRIF